MSDIPAIASIVREYPAPGATAPSSHIIVRLMEWAREVSFLTDTPEDTNWRDFKRLYKKLEARVWPAQGRKRWKQEPQFLSVDEREIETLGILLSRLESARQADNGRWEYQADDSSHRGNWVQTQKPRPPSQTTLDYMVRRAARLLRRLSASETSSQRQAFFAPLSFSLLRDASMHSMPWLNRTFGDLQVIVTFGGEGDRLQSGRAFDLHSYQGPWRRERLSVAPLAPHLWAQRLDLARRLCEECDVTHLGGSFSGVLGRRILLNAEQEVPLLSLRKLAALLATKCREQQEWAMTDIPRAIGYEREVGTLTLSQLLPLIRGDTYIDAVVAAVAHVLEHERDSITEETWRNLERALRWHLSQADVVDLFVAYPKLSLSDADLKANVHHFSRVECQGWLLERVRAAANQGDLEFLGALASTGAPIQATLVREYVETFASAFSLNFRDAAQRKSFLRLLVGGPAIYWELATAVNLSARQLWGVWKEVLQKAMYSYYFANGLRAALSSPAALAILGRLDVKRGEWVSSLRPILTPPDSPQYHSHAQDSHWTLFLQNLPLSWLTALRDIEEGTSGAVPLALPQIWREAIASRMNAAVAAPEFWHELTALPPADSAWLLGFVDEAMLQGAISAWSSEQILPMLRSSEPMFLLSLLAWFDANAARLERGDEVLLVAVSHGEPTLRRRALDRLQQLGFDLQVALRLFESGLPEPQQLVRPFFEEDVDEWARRVLALCDSPANEARAFGLELLQRFPQRWISNLLQQLAHHDDASVQAFVAAQLDTGLSDAPQIAQSETTQNFDRAILNGRGRARRAKEKVKSRLSTASRSAMREESSAALPSVDAETLREAARNGAPCDREWALAQLVNASLNGTEIKGLTVRGAVAKSSAK